MAYPRRRRMDTSKYAGANKTAYSKETMDLWPVLNHIVHTTTSRHSHDEDKPASSAATIGHAFPT